MRVGGWKNKIGILFVWFFFVGGFLYGAALSER